MRITAFTLRLNEETIEEIDRLSEGNRTEFIRRALEDALERERERELAAGFAELAGEPAEVQAFVMAQKEAMRHVD